MSSSVPASLPFPSAPMATQDITISLAPDNNLWAVRNVGGCLSDSFDCVPSF